MLFLSKSHFEATIKALLLILYYITSNNSKTKDKNKILATLKTLKVQ